ncbi:unnamed protein product [Caenorhabditis sp. 36 PRJEB53466]|nr:unnamed protein product [Caenorhabditis sp. 36 PRJEB53466]
MDIAGPSNSSEETYEKWAPVVECPICYNVYDKPVQMGCGHTLCSSCVKRLVDQVKSNANVEVDGPRLHNIAAAQVLLNAAGDPNLLNGLPGLGGLNDQIDDAALIDLPRMDPRDPGFVRGAIAFPHRRRIQEGAWEIKCPECRKPTIVPADGLPVNYRVQEMVQKLTPMIKERHMEKMCKQCNANLAGGIFFDCIQCDENGKQICSTCAIRSHNGHEVAERKALTSTDVRDTKEAIDRAAQKAYQAFEEIKPHLRTIGGIIETKASEKLKALLKIFAHMSNSIESKITDTSTADDLAQEVRNAERMAEVYKASVAKISNEMMATIDNAFAVFWDPFEQLKTELNYDVEIPAEAQAPPANGNAAVAAEPGDAAAGQVAPGNARIAPANNVNPNDLAPLRNNNNPMMVIHGVIHNQQQVARANARRRAGPPQFPQQQQIIQQGNMRMMPPGAMLQFRQPFPPQQNPNMQQGPPQPGQPQQGHPQPGHPQQGPHMHGFGFPMPNQHPAVHMNMMPPQMPQMPPQMPQMQQQAPRQQQQGPPHHHQMQQMQNMGPAPHMGQQPMGHHYNPHMHQHPLPMQQQQQQQNMMPPQMPQQMPQQAPIRRQPDPNAFPPPPQQNNQPYLGGMQRQQQQNNGPPPQIVMQHQMLHHQLHHHQHQHMQQQQFQQNHQQAMQQHMQHNHQQRLLQQHQMDQQRMQNQQRAHPPLQQELAQIILQDQIQQQLQNMRNQQVGIDQDQQEPPAMPAMPAMPIDNPRDEIPQVDDAAQDDNWGAPRENPFDEFNGQGAAPAVEDIEPEQPEEMDVVAGRVEPDINAFRAANANLQRYREVRGRIQINALVVDNLENVGGNNGEELEAIPEDDEIPIVVNQQMFDDMNAAQFARLNELRQEVEAIDNQLNQDGQPQELENPEEVPPYNAEDIEQQENLYILPVRMENVQQEDAEENGDNNRLDGGPIVVLDDEPVEQAEEAEIIAQIVADTQAEDASDEAVILPAEPLAQAQRISSRRSTRSTPVVEVPADARRTTRSSVRHQSSADDSSMPSSSGQRSPKPQPMEQDEPGDTVQRPQKRRAVTSGSGPSTSSVAGPSSSTRSHTRS